MPQLFNRLSFIRSAKETVNSKALLKEGATTKIPNWTTKSVMLLESSADFVRKYHPAVSNNPPKTYRVSFHYGEE